MNRFMSKINENLFWLVYLYAFASALSNSAITIFMALFAFFYMLGIKDNFHKSPKGFILFLIYYSWRMLTLAFNGIFTEFGRVINIWDKTPYLTVSCLKMEKEKFIRFFEILFWINCVIIVYALFQKYAGFPPIIKSLFTDDMLRFKGFFSHPLRFAGYLSSVAVISFCFAVFYSNKFIKFVPILIFGVFLTGSRTYFISIVFATLLISVFKSKKFFFFYFLAISLYGALIFAAFPQLKGRVTGSFDDVYKQQSSASLRMNFWKAGIEIFLKSPIYGIGDKEISKHLKSYKEQGFIDNTGHAHNAYITSAAESGFLGLLIYLFIFFFFIKKYLVSAFNSSDILKKVFAFSLFGVFVNLAISGIFESHFSTLVIWSFVCFLMGFFHSYENNFSEAK